MDQNYRSAKEAHVSGLQGGPMWEIHGVLSVCLASYMLWLSSTGKSTRPKSSLRAVLWEFITLVLPILLASTVLSDAVEMLAGVIALTAITLTLINKTATAKKDETREQLTPPSRHEPLLIIFRVFLQLTTILCILAVDFHIFPRKFAKVETFGTSLMDLGVGGFVFSAGVVAAKHKVASAIIGLKKPSAPESKIPPYIKFAWYLLVRTWKSALPLLVLGFGRTLLTKSVNYQEHVSEYGTHWNFFLTLGCIPFLSALDQLVWRSSPEPVKSLGLQRGFILAVLVQATYTWALSRHGLQEFILNAPRLTWLSMNREGIFSMAGYYSIYVIAKEVGQILIMDREIVAAQQPRVTRSNASTHESQVKFYYRWIRLSLLLAAFVGLFGVTSLLEMPISRRLANLPYVLWVSCVCIGFILGILLAARGLAVLKAQERHSSPAVPILFDAINTNPLTLFLLANVLTGLVNMTRDTLKATTQEAMLILLCYIATVCGMAVILFSLKIKLK